MCVFCRHLSWLHKDVYNKYAKYHSRPSASLGQLSVDTFLTTAEKKMYSSLNPRQKLLTNSLVSNVIVKCGLPVSVVDNPDFRQFLADVDAKFSVPCRQTVSYSILRPECCPEILKFVLNILKFQWCPEILA